MKTKTGLLALGLLTLVGSTIVDCGGSDSSTATTGGSKSTAGSSATTAGASSGGGTTGTAGSSAATAGTSSTGGNAATGGNSGTAGTNNNQAGAPDVGAGGAGGAGANPAGCPALMPADGTMCVAMDGLRGGCDYGTMNCSCRGRNMPTWQCMDTIGAGGAGPVFGNATCPAKAKTGNACTGQGLCAGQRCYCNKDKVTCF